MKSTPKAPVQPVGRTYTKVAECLYRCDASGVYYALLKKSGKQIRRSLKTSDRKLAERNLAEFKEKVSRLDLTQGKSRVTFDELATLCMNTWRARLKPRSARSRENSIKQLRPFFGAMPVRSITRLQCEQWAEQRSPEVAASTFNCDLESLRTILDYAQREGLIMDNPAKIVVRRRMGKVAIVIPTREQFTTLIATLRGLDIRYQAAADLIELLAYTGMRKAEANAFRLADVDFELIQRTVGNHDLDTVALLCRGANFDRALFVTLAINLDGKDRGMAAAEEFGKLYEAVPVIAAQRALRFWKVRAVA